MAIFFWIIFIFVLSLNLNPYFNTALMHRKLSASSTLWGVSFRVSSVSCRSRDLLIDDYSRIARAGIGVGVVLMGADT